MPNNKAITEINSLIVLISKSSKTISLQSTKTEVASWVNKYCDIIAEAAQSEPKVLVAITYLRKIVYNERLIKKGLISNLKIVRKHLLSSTLEKVVLSFDPSKPFTSYKVLSALFNKAKKEILIYDGYVEEGTLDILTKVPHSCTIKLLTNNTYGNFVREFKLFKKQFTSTEARQSSFVHDRFFVIDDSLFISGTSLHSVGGKKYTHIFEADSNIKNILMGHFNIVWNKSTTI